MPPARIPLQWNSSQTGEAPESFNGKVTPIVHSTSRTVAVAAGLTVAASVLTACGVETADQAQPGGELTVTTSETPTVGPDQVEDVEPVEAEETFGPVEDPGMDVTWHYQGSRSGNYGGTVLIIAVTNNNEDPLSPEAIGTPVLRYNPGGGDREEVDLLDTEVPEGAPPLQVPLDRPLGAGATTNLKYTFDITQSNLWDAELEIGNVIWTGNLNV